MSRKKILRQMIVGENRYIDSFTEYKQVMLSGNFTFIAMAILIIHGLLDYSINWPLLAHVVSFIFFGLSILLHRIGKHILANYTLLATSNLTVYVFASSESMQTGSSVFFIVITVGAFAFYNRTNKIHAIMFGVLSFLLLCLCNFTDFRILAWRDYTHEMLTLIASINFGTALIASSVLVSLLIKMNQESAKQLCENNKLLAKTNAELDSFVYSTSHDLRAPLSSLKGLINIADNVQDIAELKYYLVLMKGRVDSMNSFINEITDYSRNNRKEVGKEHVNLKELAIEVWEDLKFSPDATNIHFEMQFEETVELISDKSRLKVILSNLISNAIRYHERRKENQYIRLCHAVSGQGFYLKVEDNGQGIGPEYHQKIFDMFYRGNESSKGSGLGLYIVKETLEKLSGRISLDSKPGKGSSFTLSFPK